ncbi:MAG TPA: type II toxin-antitoxin system VapC family toxin [Beijerinckiaceae bacterium]|jgi:ribonuclease VapC
MFVDSCAIVSILSGEADAGAYASAIEAGSNLRTSAAAAWEAIAILSRPAKLGRPLPEVERFVCEWLEANDIALDRPTADERELLRLAVHAAATYGGGSNRLNVLDCFHYAHAKAAGVPILTNDRLLRATDVATAP